MSKLRIGSLFSGVGGLDLGLEAALDAETVWQVEIDPFCRGVLARHWPNAERFDDVKEVGRSNLPPVDLICGGFPCQDVSLVGKGAGLEGARSGLWFEYARIVEEMRPSFVVVENVPGLIRRGLDRVVARLHGLGYTVEGTRLRAADVGAPHQRERVFLVAYSAQVGREAASRVYHPKPPADAGLPVFDVQPVGTLRGGVLPLPNAGVLRVAHGVPDRLDDASLERVGALGNAVVPQCAYIVGRRIMELLP